MFRGWWIVAVAIVAQCFGTAPLLVYTFGIFAKPLVQAFHTNRGSIALAVSILDIVNTLTAPLAGRLIDRYGARRITILSFIGLTFALAGLSFARPPLWILYATYAAGGLLGIATTPVTFSRVVANWFDKKRGLALGLASTGVGLGIFIMPPLTQFLIDKWGWREAYLGLAALSLVIALPIVWIFLKATPEEVGLLPDGLNASGFAEQRKVPRTGMTAGEALRTVTFWQLCLVFFCVAACGNGTIAHVVPLLTDRGMSGHSAALAASLFGVASILGRVGNGYLVDRLFAPRVAAVLFSGAAAGVAILWSGVGGAAVYLASILVGLAIGAESDVMPFLVSRYFGMRSMATLYGCIFGSYTLGNATGRYLFGTGFDATGSYRTPLACAFAVLLGAVLATLALGKYRAPSEV
ncbi:MAG TPA: MFS transporter [Bryobacteraceae bacterium]|nr:MFS transporter [Bryobacteraceae bacterium]